MSENYSKLVEELERWRDEYEPRPGNTGYACGRAAAALRALMVERDEAQKRAHDWRDKAVQCESDACELVSVRETFRARAVAAERARDEAVAGRTASELYAERLRTTLEYVKALKPETVADGFITGPQALLNAAQREARQALSATATSTARVDIPPGVKSLILTADDCDKQGLTNSESACVLVGWLRELRTAVASLDAKEDTR